ncbi:MAG TPA: hypothetical protein VKG78_05230 [Opitutaceae bacterium]|nr:hypothetical protein [Opitutaceae bacterium]
MSAKIPGLERSPSWFEVSLGALLSVALGIVLGALYLALKPVKKLGEAPKDALSSTVTYVDGVRGYYTSAAVDAKRKAFVAGKSVTVDEAELNVLFSGPVKPPPAPLPPNTLVQPPPPPAPKEYDKTALNVRISDGRIQFASTYSFNEYGISEIVVVQTRGGFARNGPTFEYVPDAFYVGCCPLQRIPYVREWLLKKLLFTDPVPDDIAAAWSRLSDVTIEGSKLRLRMP